MQSTDPIEFDSELWSADKLQLTELQVKSLPTLKEVLLTSKVALSSVFRKCQPRSWTGKEMLALEKELLQKVESGPNLKCAFDVLAKVAVRHRLLTRSRGPLPRPMHPVKLEKNPFHNVDLVTDERLVDDVKTWLTNCVNQLGSKSSDQQAPEHSVRVILPFAIISSIVHFHVLHESALVALVEALAFPEKSLVFAHRNAGAWVLSLSWGGDDDAERRLLVPDKLTGTLLARISENQVRAIYAEGVERKHPLKDRHQFLLAVLNRQVASAFQDFNFGSAPTLYELLEAARTVSYFHLPAAVAALRCRKTISHVPPIEVFFRIFSGAAVNEAALPLGPQPSETELAENIDPEVSDTTEAEPIWVQSMRDAFRTQPTRAPLVAELTAIVKTVSSGAPPKNVDLSGVRIAEFAIWLLSKDSHDRGHAALSTARRYSLLIARRLGGRLKKNDPVTLTIGELEDYYREVLEDDWEDPAHDGDYESPVRNKRATVESLLRFHKFLREKGKELQVEVPALQELAPILRRRGLLPVDANFITVDEYKRVLAAIHGNVDANRTMRIALRLMVTFGFRCGLRRREIFYLRIEDLDAAEHLYVRSYSLRKVKTTNSNRAVPYGLFLDDNEKSELRDFVGARKKGRIFASTDGRELIGEEKAFELIHREMRRELKDGSLKFHHLRHSFATLVTAKLLPSTDEFIRNFLVRHPATQEWMENRESFRAQLFGNVNTRALDIQAISHLLGHGGCSVGVENYTHSLEWCSARSSPS